MAPQQTVELWVIRDRRETSERVCVELINGNINAIYRSENAAKSSAFKTEKVWKIQIDVREVSR